MKKDLSRYDLPCSRILIRSLRCRDRRVEWALRSGSPHSEDELSARVLSMIVDLFAVRLMEDRRTLKESYLCGGKRLKPLVATEAAARLEAFNQWAGFPAFAVECWRDPGPGDELSELHHELHLSRFWPPGMPLEALGALWEERLPTQKRTGVYYTPRRIVNLLCDFAFAEAAGAKGPLRVLDPACGAGYFLLEAFNRAILDELERRRRQPDLFAPLMKGESGKLTLTPERRMELLSERLFGVDVDPVALGLCRRGLLIEALAETPAFSTPAPPFGPLVSNFKEGDSILEESFPQQPSLFDVEPPPELKPFVWKDDERGFGRILKEGGFDLVIGNPPWVSLKGRHRQAPYAPDVVERLVGRWSADTYRPNIVEFFIRRAIGLLREGGVNGFVAPDRVAENEQFGPLRRFMLEHGELRRLHFREPFPGVAADTLIYVFVKRTKGRRSSRIEISDYSGRRLSAPQSYWLKGEALASVEEPQDEIELALRKMESAGRRRFSDFLETGVGFIAKPRLITDQQESESQRPVLKGEHVAPYRLTGEAWFEFEIANLAGGTRSMRKLAHPERMLLRKTGARLIAALDRSGRLPEQSLYFAFRNDRRLVKPYDLHFFLGILNSRAMSFYFRHRKITNRATTPQIKKIHLDSLPIRHINFMDADSRALHDQLAETVAEREQATEPARAKELDDLIDLQVARLYGLDDHDLELVRAEMNKGWG